MKDFFGGNIKRAYTVFQDESWCNKSNFLYHGFLFVRDDFEQDILNKLLDIKRAHGRFGREIHFKELTEHPDAPLPADGTKTRVALDWLSYSRECFKKDKFKFYILGINGNNVKNFWDNENRFDKNVYLRFFAMGLKSSVQWFKIPEVSRMFLDSGKHEAERQQRVSWLGKGFFTSDLSCQIDWRNTRPLSSDERESGSDLSNFLQLADVLIGTVRSSFVRLGKNQKGQYECVKNFVDIVERFNDKDNAFRTGSSFYKKFGMQFFPRHTDLSKEEFLTKPLSYHSKMKNIFYCDRLTHRERSGRAGQLDFLP